MRPLPNETGNSTSQLSGNGPTPDLGVKFACSRHFIFSGVSPSDVSEPIQRMGPLLTSSTSAPATFNKAADLHALCPRPTTATRLPAKPKDRHDRSYDLRDLSNPEFDRSKFLVGKARGNNDALRFRMRAIFEG